MAYATLIKNYENKILGGPLSQSAPSQQHLEDCLAHASLGLQGRLANVAQMPSTQTIYRAPNSPLVNTLETDSGYTMDKASRVGTSFFVALDLGVSVGLEDVVAGTGALPSILALAATGILPWTVDAAPRPSTVDAWRTALKAQEDTYPVAGRSPLNSSDYLAIAQWRGSGGPIVMGGASRSVRPLSALRDPEFLAIQKELGLVQGAAFPTLILAPPTSRTQALRGALRGVAQDFWAAPGGDLLRAYLGESLGMDGVQDLASLLAMFVQLPVLDALGRRSLPPLDPLQRSMLVELVGLVLTVETLTAALAQLTNVALHKAAQTVAQENDDLNRPGLESSSPSGGGADAPFYANVYKSMVARARRALPDYLQGALQSMGEVMQSGAYGPIDLGAVTAGRPGGITVPFLRDTTVRLELLDIWVHARLVGHILHACLDDWTRGREAPQSSFAQFTQVLGRARDWLTGTREPAAPRTREEQDAFRLLQHLGASEKQIETQRLARQTLNDRGPRLFERDVLATTLAVMDGLHVGIALWANLFCLTGLGLGRGALVRFCANMAARGGLRKREEVTTLLALTQRYADPDRWPGVVGANDTNLGACLALVTFLEGRGLAEDTQEVVLSILRLDKATLLGTWVAEILGVIKRTTDAQVYSLHVALAQSLPPAVFFNAKLLKHALRWHLMRLNVEPDMPVSRK